MTEGKVDHRLLRRRILRILIKLAFCDSRGEGGAAEFGAIGVHAYVFGKGQIAIEAQIEILSDRPVVLRLKIQFLIADPGPLPGKLGFHFNAGSHRLVDQGQGRSRTREPDHQRMHFDGRQTVVGQRRRLYLERRGRFFDLPRAIQVRPITEPATGAGYDQYRQNRGKSSRMRAYDCRAALCACAGSAHPCGRAPGNIAKQPRQQPAQATQQNQGQTQQKSQQVHGGEFRELKRGDASSGVEAKHAVSPVITSSRGQIAHSSLSSNPATVQHCRMEDFWHRSEFYRAYHGACRPQLKSRRAPVRGQRSTPRVLPARSTDARN